MVAKRGGRKEKTNIGKDLLKDYVNNRKDEYLV